MSVMNEQKVCLMSLLTYVKGAMTEEDLSLMFFPKFMTYLNPGSHLCECSACKASHPSVVKSISVSDPIISSDLIHYFNPDFIFTEHEACHLQNAVTNSLISMNALQNVVKYY